ncbi:MAG TPA: 6-phosphogluconolactonase, partial [Gemmatimonadaceae bacterium]|nr:6-phosphogluconolactonase [Gemmatimonadaceae bacterium]
ASLFPGDQSILTETGWAKVAQAPAQFAVAQRLTLTMRALNSTLVSITMCTGGDKRTVRDMILSVEDGTPSLPASLLRGFERSWWFVDED